MEVAIGVRLDKEVNVGAVAVVPPGGQGSPPAQAKVVLTAEGAGERRPDGVHERVGTGWQG